MIDDYLHTLHTEQGVKFHSSLDAATLERCQEIFGLKLPRSYTELLSATNGLEGYFGYFRLFGMSSSDCIDAVAWNDREFWKFAWGNRCDSYWCFGESAWGDQYAFDALSLRAGRSSEVFFLEALSLHPERIADSFEDFLSAEFIRNIRYPYDSTIDPVFRKFGPLDPMTNILYRPSPLIGGEEQIDNVITMESRAAMICQGDIAMQIQEAPENAELVGAQPERDIDGRPRVRLIWTR